MNNSVFAAIFCAAAILSGCREKATPPADTQTAITDAARLKDASNHEFTFTGPAHRIISLVPAVTEILFAVGAGEKVAAVTEYCNYPEETAQKRHIGGFMGITVDVETIAAIKPDLILISADMHGRVASLFDSLALPYFAVEPRNLDQIYDCVATIGMLTGCDDGADKVVAEMRAEIAEAEKIAGQTARPLVYWELAADPLISAGRGSFVGEAITLAGGVNIFGDLEQSWPQVSGEQVIAAAPDWILTGSDSAIGAKVAAGRNAPAFPVPGDKQLVAYYAARPGWTGIPAVKEGRVAVLNADTLYRYGPRFADAILAMAKLLHE